MPPLHFIPLGLPFDQVPNIASALFSDELNASSRVHSELTMKRDSFLAVAIAIGTPVLATCSGPGPPEATITDLAPAPGDVELAWSAERIMIIVGER